MADRAEMERRQRGFERRAIECDVCVVGGGMAGLIAAVSAARHGAKTVLVHDRPVLGGNASSEVRMWICGAHGKDNKEAGVLEEVQLENCYRNPSQIYSIWDSILYEAAAFCPGLTLLLNASCHGGTMVGNRLGSIEAWQTPSQTRFKVSARIFIDCSGDSVLAPITGAPFRIGREARSEFDEDIQPERSDAYTMGNSLLIQLRETETAQPFLAPPWAYRFETTSDLPGRCDEVRGDNFWWLEVGGLRNTISDADSIRDELVKIAYGVMDFIKNRHPKRADVANWALEWMGMLPGKRESRRYVGDHILTQNDVRSGGRFDDVVAYGGWSMDDHHPGGLLHRGPPTIYHPAPSPYGIPYRCLYSKSVPNLMFAGRNISVTHAALSSTRVMGTCSMLGQAAGTAAALCVERRCDPRDMGRRYVRDLQARLMDDDQWLPGVLRQPSRLTVSATLEGSGSGLESLRDGWDRPNGGNPHAWHGSKGDAPVFRWNDIVEVEGLRIMFDSNLNESKRMPCSFPLSGNRCGVPSSMVRSFHIDNQEPDGSWHTVFREEDNYQRLVRIPLRVATRALKVVPTESWGDPTMRVFSVDILDQRPKRVRTVPSGRRWSDVVSEAIAKGEIDP